MRSEWYHNKNLQYSTSVSVALPVSVRTAYMDDLLSLFETNDIPWSLYTGNMGTYGPIHKCYTDSYNAPPNIDGFRVYEDYAVDVPLLEVLEKHMQ